MYTQIEEMNATLEGHEFFDVVDETNDGTSWVVALWDWQDFAEPTFRMNASNLLRRLAIRFRRALIVDRRVGEFQIEIDYRRATINVDYLTE